MSDDTEHDDCGQGGCKSHGLKASRREFLIAAAGAVGIGAIGTSPVQAAAATAMSAPSGATVILPKHPDMHCHIRQGDPMATFIQCHLDAGNDILLAMPNTLPPVSQVTGPATDKSWSIQSYLDMIKSAGGDKFSDVIVPLYLSAETTPQMIDAGARSGLLRAVKYYPPHGTTNSNYAIPFETLAGSDVLRALEANGVVLCVHGEHHDMKPEEYFGHDGNAETVFYREKLPKVLGQHQGLRVSCEHLTTSVAVDFVKQAGPTIVGTVTPQHLLYTIGHLLSGLEADLYCKPLAKFEADRAALLAAVTSIDNQKFIAGTDSAPQNRVAKSTPCGCAAGCFTSGIAPQLYAQAFELGGVDLSQPLGQKAFRQFMAENAWNYWGFKPTEEPTRPTKQSSQVEMVKLTDGQEVAPLPIGMTGDPKARTASLPWSLNI